MIDYTSTELKGRNFEYVLKELESNIADPESDIYNPNWTKFDRGDTGEALLKIVAAFSHALNFYRNYYLDSLYLPTDENYTREQIYEMLNIKRGFSRTMVLTVNFNWKSCGPGDLVVIPKFFKMSINADGVDHTFLVKNDYIYMSNSSRLYVDIMLGELVEIDLKVSQVNSNTIFIGEEPIDSQTVFLSIEDKEWVQVRNIYYESDKVCKYSVHCLDDGYYIYLPVEWRNYVPDTTCDIKVRAAKIEEPFSMNTKEPVRICLLDSLFCEDGMDVTDQFEVRLMENSSVDNFDTTDKRRRVISLYDYEEEAKSYPGIVDARACNWGDGEPLGITEPFKILLTVVGESGVLDSFVKKGLKSFLESISLGENELTVGDPVVKRIDFNLLVNIGSYKKTIFEAEIYQNIKQAFVDYFELREFSIGKVINLKEIVSKVIKYERRVRYMEVMDMDEVYRPLLNEIASVGKIRITFDVEAFPNYEYSIADIFAYVTPFEWDEIVSNEGFVGIDSTLWAKDLILGFDGRFGISGTCSLYDCYEFEGLMVVEEWKYYGEDSYFEELEEIVYELFNIRIEDSVRGNDFAFVYDVDGDFEAYGNMYVEDSGVSEEVYSGEVFVEDCMLSGDREVSIYDVDGDFDIWKRAVVEDDGLSEEEHIIEKDDEGEE